MQIRHLLMAHKCLLGGKLSLAQQTGLLVPVSKQGVVVHIDRRFPGGQGWGIRADRGCRVILRFHVVVGDQFALGAGLERKTFTW